MTFLDGLLLALGLAATVVTGDLLSHRDLQRWPLIAVSLALTCLGGYLYLTWLTAIGLGAVLGAAGIAVSGRVRRMRELKALRQQAKDARERALDPFRNDTDRPDRRTGR